MFVSQTTIVSYPKPADLSRLIHEPVRLHILMHLASADGELRFSELKRRLGVTQGNLASHLRMLSRAGIIEAVHLYGEPNAEYFRMTSQGRSEFLAYLEKLQAVLALLY
jgi:DNA-binding HxlR family transcriptional regulator